MMPLHAGRRGGHTTGLSELPQGSLLGRRERRRDVVRENRRSWQDIMDTARAGRHDDVSGLPTGRHDEEMARMRDEAMRQIRLEAEASTSVLSRPGFGAFASNPRRNHTC